MAIPRETNKELIVVVENESIEVAISPPVLDSVMVVGQPPGVDPRTVYFIGYQEGGQELSLRTASGLNFVVDNVGVPDIIVQEQVLTGTVPPADAGVAIVADDLIYISTNDRSIWISSGTGTPVANKQVYVREIAGWPLTGAQDDIMINTVTRSIRRFVS